MIVDDQDRRMEEGNEDGGRRKISSDRDIYEIFCPKCFKRFQLTQDLRLHMITICGFQRKRMCPYCESTMNGIEQIHEHIRNVHPSHRVAVLEMMTSPSLEITLEEDVSSRCITTRRQQQQQQQQPPRAILPKNLLPRNCGYPMMPLIKDLATLWLAKQRIDFPYRCEKCGKGYQHRATLLRHTRHECGKEPQFKCPYCVHRTKQRGNLYQHIRTNHPGKNVFSSTA
ncbi:zinc finger Y-chromosomal protein-like [Vespula squamosa]|uniref:Zinc finger Y-chromosomal protein-like n=1 Tax=Vespula squamosa TaxID=30214 RepID=A0ABD2A2K5_VESSQ